MNPEDAQTILQWALESTLAEVEPTIGRFVKTNSHVLTRLKDHQWHALHRQAATASTVQHLQQFVHEQGLRSTTADWRHSVRLTFVDQEQREPLWFALIKLLNWIRKESSPPQQRIADLQEDLRTISYTAGLQINITLEPEKIELELARFVIYQLIAKVAEERAEREETIR